MVRAVALAVLLSGCAGVNPQDTLVQAQELLTRASYAYSAIDDAYMAVCFKRETTPECVKADELRAAAMAMLNQAVATNNRVVKKLKGEEK